MCINKVMNDQLKLTQYILSVKFETLLSVNDY